MIYDFILAEGRYKTMSLLKVRIFFFLLIGTSFLAWPAGAIGAEQSEMTKRLSAVGTGKIHGGNVAIARDEAIESGLWHAVEQETQRLLSSTAVVSHFQSLSAHIFSQSDAFIQNYKVLTESKVGRLYRVVVEVTVLTNTLRNKLESIGILASDQDLPRVILLLSEKNVGWQVPHFTWQKDAVTDPMLTVEAGLRRAFEGRDFTVLRLDGGYNGETAPEPFVATRPSDEMALRWAEQVGADIAVLGTAVAERTGNVSGTGMHAVEAHLSLRVLQVNSGSAIGSFQASNAAVHDDEMIAGTKALGLATSDIATELIRQVSASWRGETRQTSVVKLLVTGIDKYADFVQLRKTLKEDITGTKNVYLRGIRTDEAHVDVEIQGTAQGLAEELVLKNFDRFGINVLEVGRDTITLGLTPKGNGPVEDRQESMEQDSMETEPLVW